MSKDAVGFGSLSAERASFPPLAGPQNYEVLIIDSLAAVAAAKWRSTTA